MMLNKHRCVPCNTAPMAPEAMHRHRTTTKHQEIRSLYVGSKFEAEEIEHGCDWIAFYQYVFIKTGCKLHSGVQAC